MDPRCIYSSWGLTIVLYACDLTVLEACLRFLFSMFSVFSTLLVVFCMCVVHLRTDCIVQCQDMSGVYLVLPVCSPLCMCV